jgi:beta-alanine degradation protein BauB
MMTAAVSTVQIETERVRVTEWRFAPGAGTGWHRHEYDYVVVPMTTGRLLAREGGQDHAADLVCGRAYARPAGVEHDVINPGPAPFVFIEIEIKA